MGFAENEGDFEEKVREVLVKDLKIVDGKVGERIRKEAKGIKEER